jgi:hypothetical protein
MSFIYVFLTSFLLSFHPADGVPYVKLEQAIEKNDAKQLVSLGKEKILINIFGSESVYGHAQAELVLKDFFSKNPGNEFTFTFKGSPTSEGAFAIGNYSSSGKTYRITIHFKRLGENYQVESLVIEK